MGLYSTCLVKLMGHPPIFRMLNLFFALVCPGTPTVPRAWYLVPGGRYQPGTWYQVLTWYLVPGTWYLVPSTWYLVPSAGCMVQPPGIQMQTTQTTRTKRQTMQTTRQTMQFTRPTANLANLANFNVPSTRLRGYKTTRQTAQTGRLW